MQGRFTVAWISVRGCVVSPSSGGIVLVQIFFYDYLCHPCYKVLTKTFSFLLLGLMSSYDDNAILYKQEQIA